LIAIAIFTLIMFVSPPESHGICCLNSSINRSFVTEPYKVITFSSLLDIAGWFSQILIFLAKYYSCSTATFIDFEGPSSCSFRHEGQVGLPLDANRFIFVEVVEIANEEESQPVINVLFCSQTYHEFIVLTLNLSGKAQKQMIISLLY
jgi:hypothetical protein